MKLLHLQIAAFLVVAAPARAIDPREAQKLLDRVTKQKCEPDVSSCPNKQLPEAPGCMSLYNQFCQNLYSSKHAGNLDVGQGDEAMPIRLGNDENGFKQSFSRFQRAKVEAIRMNRLPADFLAFLPKDYSERLEKFIAQPKSSKLTFEEEEIYADLGDQLSLEYSRALRRTTRARIEKEIPGYFTKKQASQSPVEKLKAAKIERELNASVYQGFWKEDPRFLQARKQFDEIKAEYLKYLPDEKGLTEPERKHMMDWISTVTLEEPGSDPLNLDETCLTTEENANYVAETHKIHICAGEFNVLPSLYFTFAHELTHAVGIERSRVVAERESALGKSGRKLIESACSMTPSLSCPAEWKIFQSALGKTPRVSEDKSLPLERFRVCLQRKRKPLKPIYGRDGKETERFKEFVAENCEGSASELISNVSNMNGFVSLLLKEVPKSERDATLIENPVYLNPCGNSASIKEDDRSLGGLLQLQSVYLAAYKCSGAKTDEDKMDEAIQTAQDFIQKYFQSATRFGKSLSDDEDMVQNGFSSNSEERFADAFGNRVFTRLLESKVPKGSPNWEERRRNLFFANVPDFCDPVSVTTVDPKKSAVETRYSLEAHSSNANRRPDFLNEPMASALGCKKDYENSECTL